MWLRRATHRAGRAGCEAKQSGSRVWAIPSGYRRDSRPGRKRGQPARMHEVHRGGEGRGRERQRSGPQKPRELSPAFPDGGSGEWEPYM